MEFRQKLSGSTVKYDEEIQELEILNEDNEHVFTFCAESTRGLKEFLNKVQKLN